MKANLIGVITEYDGIKTKISELETRLVATTYLNVAESIKKNSLIKSFRKNLI